jgi:hypothetical protein
MRILNLAVAAALLASGAIATPSAAIAAPSTKAIKSSFVCYSEDTYGIFWNGAGNTESFAYRWAIRNCQAQSSAPDTCVVVDCQPF